MSFSLPDKLSDTHPLSWKYIQSLQNQFSVLDKNDLCFPLYYRPARILCDDTREQLTCHSISALPKYKHLSVEEMRSFHYNKINNIQNNTNQKNINFFQRQKYYFLELLNNSKIFIDSTYEEKVELENYFRNFNILTDDSFNSLLNNYSHNNFTFYNFVKSTNEKNYQNNNINNSYSHIENFSNIISPLNNQFLNLNSVNKNFYNNSNLISSNTLNNTVTTPFSNIINQVGSNNNINSNNNNLSSNNLYSNNIHNKLLPTSGFYQNYSINASIPIKNSFNDNQSAIINSNSNAQLQSKY